MAKLKDIKQAKANRWDNYFLDMCRLTAGMSKDPSTSVGCVIVGPDGDLRSTGFNGFPRGIEDTDDRLDNRGTKLLLMVHAETNAIISAAKVGVPLIGCSLYIVALDNSDNYWGGPPCISCSMNLIQAGICEVVTLPFKDIPSRWKDNIQEAKRLLIEAGIEYREVINGR